MKHKQATQSYYYNQGARELKALAKGEEVHIQTKSGNWKPATVLGKHDTPKRVEASFAGTGATY